jgi:hydrophobic/amphiphilic exporter-1 (mainly G- bacteria), HAE1 family
MWFTKLAISRPVTIWMLFGAIAVLGWRSMRELQIELNPRIEIPYVTVTTIYPGAGPEEMETLVTDKIEEVVASVNNVDHITSVSRDGQSQVQVQFSLAADDNQALADVRSKVDALTAQLPQDAEKPIVTKLDITAQPVVLIGLTGPVTLRDLKHLADKQISERLQRVPGVAAVTVIGGEDREVRVAVDGAKLDAYGLGINDLVQALGAATLNLPGGRIRESQQEFPVRLVGEFKNVAQIGETRLHFGAKNGRPELRLRLRDLARVMDTSAEPVYFSRVHGRDAVTMTVQKTSDANTVEVVAGARKAMASILQGLGPGYEASYAQDQSEQVQASQHELMTHLMVDIFLVVLVVFMFLHSLRGTLIVALAIPTALLATFIPMRFFGFTLNSMTMLGLALVIGVLVDDAIVVLENIFRHLKDGESPREAAFNGRTEIGLAAITITLVDVVVFVPVGFMGGIVGRFFREFGLTVAMATLFSLFVSFTLTPMLAARLYKRGEAIESDAGFFRWLNRVYDGWERNYRRALGWALRRRGLVILTGFAALVATMMVFAPKLGFQFIPVSDQGVVSATIETPVGTSLFETDAVVRQVENAALKLPEAKVVSAQSGRVSGGFRSFGDQGPNYGSVSVTLQTKRGLLDALTPWRSHTDLRERRDTVVAADLRQAVAGIPGAQIHVLTQSGWGGTDAPVQIELRGRDLDEIVRVANTLRAKVAEVPGVSDTDLSWRVGVPEVQLHIDRDRAAELGYSVTDIARVMRTAIEGNTDFKYREGGDEYDLRVQLERFDRNSVAQVGKIFLGQVNGGPVYLRDVARIEIAAGPNKIERKDRERQVVVLGNLRPGFPLGNAQRVISAAIQNVPLGSVSLNWGGQAQSMKEEGGYMAAAISLAILLVYMLQAALFESFLTPLVIMFSVPMAIVGAILALVLTHSTLSIISLIGFIMLMGLVTKNAILLLDYTITLRRRGMGRDEALQTAGPTRLRPIIMTTLSIVFGLLPLSLKLGPGSEQRAPLAIAVQGGLIVSTMLTLLVIPCLYSLTDDWAQAWRRLGRRTRGLFGRPAKPTPADRAPVEV